MQLKRASLLRQQAFINGHWQDADSACHIDVYNPANGELIGRAPNMGKEETRRAIEAASQAFSTWKTTTADERSELLLNWYELILENTDDLAEIMTAEQGKPLAEAKGEVAYGASFLKWYAEEARRIYGETIPSKSPDQRILVIRQPVGVCATITPWNFPIAMITRKAAPALAAGCTLVSRPASLTPLSALALAVLAEEAGFPKGVINILTGDSSTIGGELCSNKDVRKLSFTGSTNVGRKLMAQCASTVKNISMELGGNAPFIVFDDADLDAAVDGVIVSKFRNTGQTCVCANRIYVQKAVIHEFAERLSKRISELRVGPGDQEDVDQGPLINQSALDKVEEHIRDAKDKGAKVLLGGQPDAQGGLFYTPTLLTDCSADMLIASEETFGPVAPLFPFDDEADALRLANASEVGLAGYFYSKDMARIMRVAESLEVGMVGVNSGLVSNAAAPFGGVKQSGIGREGGHQGINEYLEEKYILLAGL